MKKETKILLKEAQQYCDDNNKSTEFMLQYMQDMAGVDLDTVMEFLMKEKAFEVTWTDHTGRPVKVHTMSDKWLNNIRKKFKGRHYLIEPVLDEIKRRKLKRKK